MTKNYTARLLACVLVITTLLTGCVEIAVKEPEEKEETTSHTDQTVSDSPAALTEDGADPEPAGSNTPAYPADNNIAADSDEAWVEYTAAQAGISFKHPRGWDVEVAESAVSIDSKKTNEQLFMSMMPFDENKNPADLAADFIILLQTDNPNVNASNWRAEPGNESNQVFFDLSDEIGGETFSGTGIVMKDSEQAVWFSYFAPASAYSYDRGIELLQGFIGSITSGSGSDDSSSSNNSDLAAQIDANAKGFMFVLEFALGAPFTNDQEQVILDELKSGWRTLTKEELSAYDQYPLIAKAILTMGQDDLNEIRAELENATKEWLGEAPDSDRAVRIIRDQLETRGRAVIDGDPPLTEMSLTAYSEIIAYSRLLRQDPEALPEQISKDSVNDIKKQVMDSWESFSDEEQQQIAASPGLWFCLRTLVNNGTEKEQDEVRNNLIKLTPETQKKNGSGKSASNDVVMDMAAHTAMMNIQQMTFNHYMWTHGFNYSPSAW